MTSRRSKETRQHKLENSQDDTKSSQSISHSTFNVRKVTGIPHTTERSTMSRVNKQVPKYIETQMDSELLPFSRGHLPLSTRNVFVPTCTKVKELSIKIFKELDISKRREKE